jgi:alpha/beta superfamily hydrolase
VVSGQLAGDPAPAPVAAAAAPSDTRSRTLPGPLRVGLSFVVGLGGLLIVAAGFGGSPWSWLLWIVAGAAAGAIAHRMAHVWLAPVIVAAFYLTARAMGLVTDQGPFWLIGAVIGVALVAAGFAVGTLIGWRQSPRLATRHAWRGISRTWRVLLVAVLVVAVVGLAGYTGYIGMIGSQEFTHPASGWPGCDTPGTRFGWDYEAINYDKADDAVLAATNPDMTKCSSQGSQAGNVVVSPDGVRLAGWYIPAASGVGPTGATVVIVPGWKSNKSEVLRYAPPLHDRYNLVLVDLRNQGRSAPADVTLGLHEQKDVAAMIDWLVATKHPHAIAAQGNSMGAATVLAEAQNDPRVQALILDSMHANIDVTVGNVLETEHGYPSVPAAIAIITGVDLRIGGDVASIDPVRTIARIGDRPVLLIQSTTDKLDPPAQASEKNFRAAMAAGVPVELHYCKGVTAGNGSHGTVVERCPDDWSRWANQFLEASLPD